MNLITLLNWETVLDLVGILLCLVIVAYLAYNKRKFNRSIPHSGHQTESIDFHRTVLFEYLKQRTDSTLNAIIAQVEQERRELHRWLTSAATENLEVKNSLPGLKTGRAPTPWSIAADTQPTPASGDRYSKVALLADSGMPPDQISEKSRLPVDEIELYLRARGA